MVDAMGRPLRPPHSIVMSVSRAAASNNVEAFADQFHSHARDSLGGSGPAGVAVRNWTHPVCIKSPAIASGQ